MSVLSRVPLSVGALALAIAAALAPAPVLGATACYNVSCASACSPTPPAAVSALITGFPVGGSTPIDFVDPDDGLPHRFVATKQGLILVWDGATQALLVRPSSTFGTTLADRSTTRAASRGCSRWPGGERKVRTLLSTEHDERNAALSPDGKYMVFESDLSGKLEIYVRPFPTGTGKWQISTDGGGYAAWTRGGREIIYQGNDRKLMAVDIRLEPTFQAGTPKVLFDPRMRVSAGKEWDVMTPTASAFS